MISINYLFNRNFKLNFNKKQNLKWIVNYINYNLYNKIDCITLNFNTINIFIQKENLLFIIKFLKFNNLLLCMQLMDFTIIDKLEMSNSKRFEYIYVLLSTIYNIRIIIRGYISIFEFLPSITSLFKSAGWLEREVWDLYGINIKMHPNLRKILTDYGFVGYPLRKDFPLSGYVEVRYDEILKIIVIEPIELSQEFRMFNLEIPWKIL